MQNITLTYKNHQKLLSQKYHELVFAPKVLFLFFLFCVIIVSIIICEHFKEFLLCSGLGKFLNLIHMVCQSILFKVRFVTFFTLVLWFRLEILFVIFLSDFLKKAGSSNTDLCF